MNTQNSAPTSAQKLYYGAYRSGSLEMRLAQIERFLDAVDLLTPDKETPSFTVRSPRDLPGPEHRFRKTIFGLQH
jgi:hypothetical protein